MNFKAFRIFSLSALLACAASLAAQTIQLNGEWTATLPGEKPQAMQLPGTLDMAGIGQPDTLQPAMTKPQLLRLTRKHSYIGPCTYARTIEITPDMAGKPLRLTMERVLWKSSLKVDGKPVGTANESLHHRFFRRIDLRHAPGGIGRQAPPRKRQQNFPARHPRVLHIPAHRRAADR